MKTKKYFWGILTVLMVAMLSVGTISCGSDGSGNVNNVPLNSYIIGSWHSYRGVVYASGNTYNVDIDKTGEMSAAYFEFVFQEGGKVILRGWLTDSNGLSHWIEEMGTYTINNDIVNVTDADGVTVSMVYDPKESTLCIRINGEHNGVYMVINVFLCK